jgi:hypothetical protein
MKFCVAAAHQTCTYWHDRMQLMFGESCWGQQKCTMLSLLRPTALEADLDFLILAMQCMVQVSLMACCLYYLHSVGFLHDVHQLAYFQILPSQPSER